MSGYHYGLNKYVSLQRATTGWTTGVTTSLGAAIDLAGYEGACFICPVIKTTATVTLQVAGSTATGGTYTTLANCQAETTINDDRFLIVDVFRPTFRFLKAVVNSTGTSDKGGPVGVLLYGGRSLPSTHSSDVTDSTNVSYAAT